MNNTVRLKYMNIRFILLNLKLSILMTFLQINLCDNQLHFDNLSQE